MSDVQDAFPTVVETLVSYQLSLQTLKNPSAKALIHRALLLKRLGAMDLAIRDALFAWQVDPADPTAQAHFCRLSAAITPAERSVAGASAHDCAVELLQNPFANRAERQAALPVLDPARLPLLLRLALPVTERLTLVQRVADRVEISGLDQRDLPEALGQAKTGGQRIAALDYFVLRPDQGTREVCITVNGTPQRWSVAAPGVPSGLQIHPTASRARLWIVMPVKDGGAVLETCLTSVRAALGRMRGVRLVLVDDCSERDETRALLADQARDPAVTLCQTDAPLGFTGAVNLGLAAVGRGPVLLLNSDTLLPEHVLPRLLAHLDAPQAGTVTPLSNNAGSLSLLGPGRPCALPSAEICESLARAAHARNPGVAIDIPNGNGFCMLISEACLHATGPLSGRYESGYYEEVDFCLRASAKGFRHVAAADCFVGHAGSVSYGAARHRLISLNRRRLHQRFPNYAARYERFAAFDPLRSVRAGLLADLAPVWTPVPLTTVTPAMMQAQAMPTPLILPQVPGGPVVIPVSAPDLPEPLRKPPFTRLRLVPEAALSAAGLRLCPAHPLRADWYAGTLVLRQGGDATCPMIEFECAGADAHDFAAFEAAALALCASAEEGQTAHALSL